MSVVVTAGDLPTGAVDHSGDLVGGTPGDWLVIGWFTPDYRPLAKRFAANLAEHGAPHHLWARPKLAKGWNTLPKPSVALLAMDAYPGKTLVLMDVDCIVRGDISPVTDFAGDVGININAIQSTKGKTWRRPVLVAASSRVVVFRPTEQARALAQEWEGLCKTLTGKTHNSGDETALMWAYLRRPDVRFSYVDRRYSGCEIGRQLVADAVVCHDSAHEKQRPVAVGIKSALKAIERRFFRTGRTKQRKAAGEMSIVSKQHSPIQPV
jgi:hypothetical protein